MPWSNLQLLTLLLSVASICAFCPSQLNSTPLQQTMAAMRLKTTNALHPTSTTLRGGGESNSPPPSPTPTTPLIPSTPSQPEPTITPLLLLTVYISNQWSRSLLFYLTSFTSSPNTFTQINAALNLSQTQYGLLASIYFTILFSSCSFLAGSIVDKYPDSEKKLTLFSSSCLALSMTLMAVSTSFPTLLASRFLTGIACAFTTPAAYKYLQRIYTKATSITPDFASGVYSTAVYAGGALSSLSILADERFGWRVTSGIVAVVCLLSTVAVWAGLDELKGSGRNMNDPPPSKSITNKTNNNVALEIIASNPLIYLATFFRFSAGLAIGVWGATYFKGAFPDRMGDYAIINSAIVAIAGGGSAILGGRLSGYINERFNTPTSYDYRLLIPAVGSLLTIPFFYTVVTTTSFNLALASLGISYFICECWFAPVIAHLCGKVGVDRQGTALGLFTVIGGVANAAPALIGGVVENIEGVELGVVLSIGVSVAYLASSLLFAGAMVGGKIETK